MRDMSDKSKSISSVFSTVMIILCSATTLEYDLYEADTIYTDRTSPLVFGL